MSGTIRRGRAEDLAAIVEIYNHYVAHSAATFDTQLQSLDDRRPWLASFGTGRHQLFVATDDEAGAGALLGYAYSGVMRPRAAYDRSVETSIYLAPDAVGHGLGARLYGHLFEALAATDVHRCYGVVTAPNPASVALHQRMGFTEVGRLSECGYKFDRWWDVLWLEKPLPAET